MNSLSIPHIGMRKIKSLISVTLVFVIWQIVCFFFPSLEPHPIFGYMYAILEIRDTADKTKEMGKLRIKATLSGLAVGLLFVSLSNIFCSYTDVVWHHTVIDFALIIIATLVSLTLAEIIDCKSFCGVASIITVVCLVSNNDGNRYFYAVMRVFQTVLGVCSALLINTFIRNKNVDTKE